MDVGSIVIDRSKAAMIVVAKALVSSNTAMVVVSTVISMWLLHFSLPWLLNYETAKQKRKLCYVDKCTLYDLICPFGYQRRSSNDCKRCKLHKETQLWRERLPCINKSTFLFALTLMDATVGSW